MKSNLYRKHRASKYQFPTRIVNKTLQVGWKKALVHIQSKLGRRLEVAKTNHTRTEWVFYEKKGAISENSSK